MKIINTWCILAGHHQSDISCYKHLPESSKSATRNVNSPMCYHGCHFVNKLEWGPQHKATKLPVVALIGCSDQIFSAILGGPKGVQKGYRRGVQKGGPRFVPSPFVDKKSTCRYMFHVIQSSKCFKQKKNKLQTVVYMCITHRPCDIVLKL